jgi:hypothetical protein
MWRGVLLLVLLLTGCAPRPLTPADLQARKFEAMPDKAVIYIVRDDPDLSREPATITLDDTATITTHPGTYYRWEAEPGQRRIEGFAGHVGWISFPAEAGRLYFVHQRVSELLRFGQSFFALLPEPHGRAAVIRAEMIGGQ